MWGGSSWAWVEESKGLCDLGESLNAFSLEYAGFLLSRQLEHVGEGMDREVVELHALIRQEEEQLDVIDELLLYTGSAQRTLMHQSGKRIDLEDACDAINARKNALLQLETRLGASEAESSAEIAAAKEGIRRVEQLKGQKQVELAEFTRLVLRDVGAVFAYFSERIKTSLQDFALCQIKWHERSVEIWRE